MEPFLPMKEFYTQTKELYFYIIMELFLPIKELLLPNKKQKQLVAKVAPTVGKGKIVSPFTFIILFSLFGFVGACSPNMESADNTRSNSLCLLAV